MSEPRDKPQDWSDEVGAKESRKIQARQEKDRTLWFGLGMFGMIGWSVAVPTLLGVALGMWLDQVRGERNGRWALALLLAGVTLGCFNAWYWVSREHQAMEQDQKEKKP